MDFLNLEGLSDATPEGGTTNSNVLENDVDYTSSLISSSRPGTNNTITNRIPVGSVPNSNNLSSSFNENGGSLSKSLTSSSIPHQQQDDSNIRASLSRALNHPPNQSSISSNAINFPIPEEDEDDNSGDEEEQSQRRSSTTPKINSQTGSRRGTITAASPGGSSLQPIDRKRRDNMNEKIYELMKIMPAKLFEERKDKSSGTKDGKPNKGQILTKTVEYINYLQAQIDEKNRKEVELSIKLRNLEIESNVPVAERMNLLHTSAEIGLAKIGVGPLADQQQFQQQQQQQQQQQGSTPTGSKGGAGSYSDFNSPNNPRS